MPMASAMPVRVISRMPRSLPSRRAASRIAASRACFATAAGPLKPRACHDRRLLGVLCR